ncbi:MAG: tetratricopeptide (TPR) repeat protein [Flavobacteriales bacterium]
MNYPRFTRLILFVLIVCASCTTKKDGFVYRVFHNTTARYNGYFYAKEAMREADLQLADQQLDDYDEILPLFIMGDEQAAQGIFPQMERAIEKSSLVIERHTMKPQGRSKKKSKRPEINKWIDDNYLLIGVAYFYKQNYFKAEEMFLYVSRKYREPEMQALANSWLTRCHVQREAWTSAKNAILKAEQIKNLEPEVKAEVLLVYADYFIKQEIYDEAAETLKEALRYIEKKRDRARPTYILAQLMQKMNKSSEAINYYESVLKLKPSFEMEFYAKISQALAFERRGGNSGQIKETLFKMLKDEKNEEYRDQIYYALAEIELKEQKRDIGISYLEESLKANIDNQRQKMKSFLRLADLYLEDKDYPLAQAYYDSTYKNIEEEHKRYLDVKNKAESLTELVTYLNVIDEQDSISQLCGLDDDQLIRKMKKIRRQMVEKQEQELLAAEAAFAAANQGVDQGNSAAFWPYNTVLKERGQQAFTNLWGSIELEDNWRRSNKLQQSFDQGDEEEDEEVVVEEKQEEGDEIPSVEELIAALPCSEADLTQGDSDIANAYYNSGVIYREKLEDLDNAIEQWEVLVTRFDESEFHPTSYYLLHRTYLFRENTESYSNPFCGTCNSKHWGDIIFEKYPNSKWSQLVENPNYQDYAELKKAEERTAYEGVLSQYYSRQYRDVVLQTDSVIRTEPENSILCKYKVLRAQAVGYLDGQVGIRATYLDALEGVKAECPGTEEALFAEDLLMKLNGGNTVRGEGDEKEPTEEAPVDSPYKYDANSRHYFMLILPMGEGAVNKIKGTLSNFTSVNFATAGLKVSSSLIDRDNQLVLVKTFNRLDDAKSFISTFNNNDDVKELREAGYKVSLISKENYVTLFKTKEIESYQVFYEANYVE